MPVSLTPAQRKQMKSNPRPFSGLNVPVMDKDVTTVKTGRKDVLPRRVRKKPKLTTIISQKIVADKATLQP